MNSPTQKTKNIETLKRKETKRNANCRRNSKLNSEPAERISRNDKSITPLTYVLWMQEENTEWMHELASGLFVRFCLIISYNGWFYVCFGFLAFLGEKKRKEKKKTEKFRKKTKKKKKEKKRGKKQEKEKKRGEKKRARPFSYNHLYILFSSFFATEWKYWANDIAWTKVKNSLKMNLKTAMKKWMLESFARNRDSKRDSCLETVTKGIYLQCIRAISEDSVLNRKKNTVKI